MADYSNPPAPKYSYSDVRDAELGGYAKGFSEALIAVAKKNRKVDNAPLRCPLCEHYIYDEDYHECLA